MRGLGWIRKAASMPDVRKISAQTSTPPPWDSDHRRQWRDSLSQIQQVSLRHDRVFQTENVPWDVPFQQTRHEQRQGLQARTQRFMYRAMFLDHNGNDDVALHLRSNFFGWMVERSKARPDTMKDALRNAIKSADSSLGHNQSRSTGIVSMMTRNQSGKDVIYVASVGWTVDALKELLLDSKIPDGELLDRSVTWLTNESFFGQRSHAEPNIIELIYVNGIDQQPIVNSLI